jgi:predicted GIY-YIG superfamily endonuclease
MARRAHYHVYVVELRPEVFDSKRFRDANPDHDRTSPVVYVGMTGLTPERRFVRHKAGVKAGRGWVRDYGIRLRPELYADLNPMTYAEAVEAERELAETLRRHGFAVIWG